MPLRGASPTPRPTAAGSPSGSGAITGGNRATSGLIANGLPDELRLGAPAISGARLTVNGIGGDPGATFILSSTTNVAKPFSLWTPVLTTQFDQYGVLTYTNVYNPALTQQYFRFLVP